MLVQKIVSHPQIDVRFALHPVRDDEQQTCLSLVENVRDMQGQEKEARILLMPTHHMSEFGSISGFRFEVPSDALGISLPVSRNMFFGHTLVECKVSEDYIWRFVLKQVLYLFMLFAESAVLY